MQKIAMSSMVMTRAQNFLQFLGVKYFMQIYSFSPFGYEGNLVTVEVDLKRGIPAIDMVGLADGAVKESRERMKSAIRNSGFEFPVERILISLSPADLKKEGAGFDLPVALSVLCASNQNEGFPQDSEMLDFPVMVMGELELSGTLRPVRAIHAAASTARSSGISHCIVPAANASEAREVSGMKVFGAQNLREAFSALSNSELFTQADRGGRLESLLENSEKIEDVEFAQVIPGSGFEEIFGQPDLVRALQIAAAGAHNVLAFGPPGCGKTLAMQRFSSLLPLLTLEEAQSTTRIYSIAGLLSPSKPLVRTPPFRSPHQSSTLEGICGGGTNCRPGEISLAHNGILFLDEAAEFRASVLQMLRVPLESGAITLSRAGRSTIFPAKFQLLMATNPCPCGNFGSEKKLCLCSSRSIENYWKKFSAPLLDRIDLRVKVDLADEENSAVKQNYSTRALRQKIAIATKIQRERQGTKNARLKPEQIREICVCTNEAREMLERAASRHDFSPRANAACYKIARTIADMEASPKISAEHMAEAIDLRKFEDIL